MCYIHNYVGPQIQLGVLAVKVNQCENVYASPDFQSSQRSESKDQSAVRVSNHGYIYVNPSRPDFQCSLTDNEDTVLSCIEQGSYSSSFKSDYAQY